MKKYFILFVITLSLCTYGYADENSDWDSSVAFSMNLTNGNSNTFLGNISYYAKKRRVTDEIMFGFETNYGEAEIETNVQNSRCYADYKYLFDKRNYVYFNMDLSQNEISDIDYRFYLGPGMGRYVIRSEKISLGLEGGVSYIKEKLGGIDDDRLVLRLYERFEYKPSDTSRIWQYLEYLPSFEEFSNYLLNFELGIETAINSHLNLRLVAQDKYNNVPAVGKEKNDLTFLAGVSYKF
ncbi:MAG: DUF481 domain-containing protein [Candidatus Aureabacteria bacterium]|nr:DUF481 domain-containing protein [Candidatus Auribacterota bacterium]